MSRCDDDWLKSCIIAASTSVWSVHEMYPAQLDAVYHLLHPMCPNHLAVIQRTGAGKTHILRTLGVIERGIILIIIPLLTLSADVMFKFTCADLKFGAVAVQHLNELFEQINKSTTTHWSDVAAFVGPPQQLYSSSCRHSSL